MASKLIGIVGETSTGKSTSIKHLNPDETYIINVAKKELPFKGSEKMYNADKKNYKEVDDANEISRLLKTTSRTLLSKILTTSWVLQWCQKPQK